MKQSVSAAVALLVAALLTSVSCTSTAPAPAAPPMRSDSGDSANSANDKRAVELIRALSGAKYLEVVSAFSPTLKEKLPADRLSLVWQKISSEYGNVVSIGAPVQSWQDQNETITIPVTFERSALRAKVVFDHRLVSGLFFYP